MLYKDQEELKLSNLKVRYIQHGEGIEQFVGEEGKQWWIDFASKWSHTQILEFIDVEHTTEQLARLDEIKNLNISEVILQDYVVNGIVGDGLEILTLKNENQELKQLLADLTETVLLGGGM